MAFLRIIITCMFLLSIIPQKSDFEQWCVADEQTPDAELQAAMDWACGPQGGADCSTIQTNRSCYYPNTTKDHASVAFNSYFQKFKNKGGSYYFKGAALITELDPNAIRSGKISRIEIMSVIISFRIVILAIVYKEL